MTYPRSSNVQTPDTFNHTICQSIIHLILSWEKFCAYIGTLGYHWNPSL